MAMGLIQFNLLFISNRQPRKAASSHNTYRTYAQLFLGFVHGFLHCEENIDKGAFQVWKKGVKAREGKKQLTLGMTSIHKNIK